MQREIERRFVSVEKRLKTVEGGVKDYRAFKPAIGARLKTVETKIREYVQFKSTMFMMMEDLSSALEQLSGISLQFRSEFHHHQAAYSPSRA